MALMALVDLICPSVDKLRKDHHDFHLVRHHQSARMTDTARRDMIEVNDFLPSEELKDHQVDLAHHHQRLHLVCSQDMQMHEMGGSRWVLKLICSMVDLSRSPHIALHLVSNDLLRRKFPLGQGLAGQCQRPEDVALH